MTIRIMNHVMWTRAVAPVVQAGITGVNGSKGIAIVDEYILPENRTLRVERHGRAAAKVVDETVVLKNHTRSIIACAKALAAVVATTMRERVAPQCYHTPRNIFGAAVAYGSSCLCVRSDVQE